MKKRHYIAFVILLAGLVVSGWLYLHPRQLPLEKCDAICRHYADNPHVEVVFIRDFPVNDTLCLDVTTLRACDSIGWDSLMHFFGVPQDIIERYNNTLSNKEKTANISFRIEKDNPAKRPLPDSGPCPYVVANVKEQVFSVYHVREVSQFAAVIHF